MSRISNIAERIGAWVRNRQGGGLLSKPQSPNDKLREWINPLRGLKITGAVQTFEACTRGDHAQPQWLFHNMERSYPTLSALISRRVSAIEEMDGSVHGLSEEEWPEGVTEAMVDAQVEALKAAYARIDNFTEALTALAMATFRGFALIEKQDLDGDGNVDHFGITDTWNWVRDGMHGPWYWNPEAKLYVGGLAGQVPIDESLFLIRTVERPIDVLALSLFCRSALGEKDWSSFLEIFAVPGGVVIGPPSVPEKLQSVYEAAGEQLARGGVGYLPNGSEYKPNNPPHAGAPFETFLRYQQEQLVLAGTGGQLTMLAESGSGTLAGNAHADTFRQIARSEGALISSSIFQRQFDKPLLERLFPGQPVLAYFALDVKVSPTTREIITDVKDLAAAGYKVTQEEVEMRTGYEFDEPADPMQVGVEIDPETGQPSRATVPSRKPRRNAVRNKASREIMDAVARAAAKDLEPVRLALEQIMEMKDDAERRVAIKYFLESAPVQARDILSKPAAAEALANAMATSYVNGLAKARADQK